MHDLNWLMKEHPDAYNALPEPYKNDSCLVFGVNEDGLVYAKAAPGQEYALGTDGWYFSYYHNEWKS